MPISRESWGRWVRYVLALAACALPCRPAPAQAPWTDFQVIVWQDVSPARAAGLRRLGITAGRVFGERDDAAPIDTTRAAALRASGLGVYVENIATDFYAPYHRWHPDRPVDALFQQARRAYAADATGRAAFLRQPSLSDPAALVRITDRLRRHVAAYGALRPLYYSLGDETGIADLAANWDFDFSPPSLSGFRDWLRGRYGSLGALNAQWGSDWRHWDDVPPMTTDEALARADGNVSAWMDFKEWMDEAFARAVRAGTDAVHAADPAARAAIEGAQVPGWGGYDYARLAPAVDVMEIYDSGENIAIARAMNPDLVVLTTAAGADAAAQRAIWRALLLGARGLILWDPDGALVDHSGEPGPFGRAIAPLLAELRGGLAARLIANTPPPAPVALVYSPASFRRQWLLDRAAEGGHWTDRTPEDETRPTPLRAAMHDAAHAVAALGLPPRWIAAGGLADTLADPVLRAVLLPHVIALSDADVAALRAFEARGGMVLADVQPGRFDDHGRARATEPLGGVGLDIRSLSTVMVGAGRPPTPFVRRHGRLGSSAFAQDDGGAGAPGRPVIDPPLTITDATGAAIPDIEATILHDGDAMIIALLRDARHGERTVWLTLPEGTAATDLRTGRALPPLSPLAVTVGDVTPTILALSPPPPR